MTQGTAPLKEAVETIFAKLTSPVSERKTALLEAWPHIAGPNISPRTRAHFGLNKQIYIWVDDSTLAFELGRKYKHILLKRLQNQFGESEVTNIRFFVGELRT